MFLRSIYDESLAAASYLIGCQRTGEAIVVDPQRDVDRYITLAANEGLSITAVTETHIHADFLSGTRELAQQTGAKVLLSAEGGAEWSYGWLNKNPDGGSYPHELLNDGKVFSIGNIEFRVVHTPGHTPEHICFLVTDRGSGATEPMGLLSGDFLFVGDLGRPDLLESAAGKAGAALPAATSLFDSVKKLSALPDFIQVWPAHGAGSACGKALGAVPSSTIGYEKRFNPAVRAATKLDEFQHFILDGQPEPPLYFARMKRENRDGPALLGPLPEPREVGAKELAGLDYKKVLIVDTRGWDEFRAAHFRGSLFHPLNKTFVTDVGSMAGDGLAEVYLIAEPYEVDAAVRNLVRVGVDKIVGWGPPSVVAEAKQFGVELVSTPQDDVATARSKIAAHSVHVVDVRRAVEMSDGRIDGSRNIVHTRLASQLNSLPHDRPLLVHCRSGMRSAIACSLLQRAGFEVSNLKGGMMAWQKQ